MSQRKHHGASPLASAINEVISVPEATQTHEPPSPANELTEDVNPHELTENVQIEAKENIRSEEHQDAATRSNLAFRTLNYIMILDVLFLLFCVRIYFSSGEIPEALQNILASTFTSFQMIVASVITYYFTTKNNPQKN